jgi:CO/xanthine dehydrogenase FAD-binding subunit
MDLHTVTKVRRPAKTEEIDGWEAGCAWLAGGTWLFSEPQPQTRTLIDLEGFRWPALTATAEGLEIAATCKVVELDNFAAPSGWIAARLFRECCRSFLASFKIWNEATVGGNIVMSLPAGPMISLTAALEGVFPPLHSYSPRAVGGTPHWDALSGDGFTPRDGYRFDAPPDPTAL